MKKRILIFIFLVFSLFGCKEEKLKEIKTNIKREMIEEEEYGLEVLDKENNNNITDFEVVFSKEGILEYKNGVIKAIKYGTTDVSIYLSDKEYLKIEVKVLEKEKQLIDFSVSFEESIMVGTNYKTKIELIPEDVFYNIEVITSSHLESSVDGLIIELKGINVGIANIVVKVNDISKSYKIEVKPLIINPTDLIIEIPDKVGLYQELSFSYNIKPSNSSYQELVITSKEMIEVNENKIKFLEATTCTIEFRILNTDIVVYKEVVVSVDNNYIANEILKYALDSVGTYGIDEVILPKTHPEYGGNITFISEDSDLFDVESGFLGFPDFDEEVKVKCFVTYNDIEVSKEFVFVVAGYEMEKMSTDFIKPIKVFISRDIEFVTELEDFGGTTITWYSSNEDVFDNQGKFTQPINDTYITITYTITTTNPAHSKTYTKEVMVRGCNLLDKCEMVQEWIYSNVCVNKVISSDTILPTEIKMFEVNLKWCNTDNEELDINNLPANFITAGGSYINVIVSNYSGEKRVLNLYCEFKAKEFGDMWEKIELFLNSIYKENITNQKFNLFGFESGYTVVDSQNIGYIPFIDQTKTTRIQEIVSSSRYWVRSNTPRTSTEYIVVHNTGCAAPTKTAKVLSDYINNLDISEGYKSWHFTVDDKEIYQQLPIEEVGWHAGDGSTTFPNTWSQGLGGGNQNGVGIETCCYKGIDFNDAMRNLAKLVAELLIQYNLKYDRIKQHYDFSGKNCPQVIRESNRWNELIRLVQLEYFYKTQLNGVQMEYKSLTPDVLDNHGRVINHTGKGTPITYEVLVTYNNITRNFKFTSYLDELH